VNQKKQKIIVAVFSFIAACVIVFFIQNAFFKVASPVSPHTGQSSIAPIVIAGTAVTLANSFEWSLPGQTMTLLVASTSAEQQQGLSDVPFLASTTGMLFVFDTPDDYGFWMKDMRFPLDIIWLDQSFKIIHIEYSLSPSTYPQVFYPGSPAKYVIEVNAGFVKEFSLSEGQTMQIYKK
jgi:uncharacterized membrane protein (UPF0127 family)